MQMAQGLPMTPLTLAARVCLGLEPGLHLFIEPCHSGRVTLLISGKGAPAALVARRSEWAEALREAAKGL